MTPSGATERPRLLAVGETMAMVVPTEPEELTIAVEFHLDAGGAESNVAAHVVALGHPASWFSKLGDDALGRRVAGQLAARGVQVDSVVFDPAHPTGVYFKNPGHGVLYYRAGSAASQLSPADADTIELDGIEIVHVSGITAALSPTAAAFLDRLIERVRESDALLSFDVNYRPALWGVATAAPVLDALTRRADLVFVGRDEAETLWGTPTPHDVRERFSEVAELVVKDGEVGATTFADGAEVFEPTPTVEVVELVGAGDAFAGGYLAARLTGRGVAERLRSGHERAGLTLQTMGDSVDERMVP